MLLSLLLVKIFDKIISRMLKRVHRRFKSVHLGLCTPFPLAPLWLYPFLFPDVGGCGRKRESAGGWGRKWLIGERSNWTLLSPDLPNVTFRSSSSSSSTRRRRRPCPCCCKIRSCCRGSIGDCVSATDGTPRASSQTKRNHRYIHTSVSMYIQLEKRLVTVAAFFVLKRTSPNGARDQHLMMMCINLDRKRHRTLSCLSPSQTGCMKYGVCTSHRLGHVVTRVAMGGRQADYDGRGSEEELRR